MYISLVSVVLFVVLAVPAAGQTTIKSYDSRGNYRGKTTQEGDRLVHRDQNGNERGYGTIEAGKIVEHDVNGNRRGYTVQSK